MFKKIRQIASSAVSSNWSLRIGFMASLLLLSLGGFRLAYFTLPMWHGNYEYAGTRMDYYSSGDSDENNHPLEMKETVWSKMEQGAVHLAWQSGDFLIGSRSQALFNSATLQYQAADYAGARLRFEKAYTELCDNQGAVSPGNRKQASLIQTMIGNCWDNAGKKENAAPYYEQALSLDPQNLLATWLLERLQDSSGGGGSKSDKPDDNPKPAAPRKRI